MKRMNCIITLSLLLYIFTSQEIYAQAQALDPDADYEKALQFYNYGMADSALNVLKPYLENNKELNKLSKGRCASFFRLAALSAIMTDNAAEAEAYVRHLVTYRPDYRHNYRENDLTEFRLMVDKAVSRPSVRIGVMGGVNIPIVTVQKKYSDYASPADAYSIDQDIGYQFNIFGEKAFSERISIEVAAGITQILFKYFTKEQESEYQYDESITYIEIPVTGRFSFLADKPCKPYLELGLFSRFSLSPREESDQFGRYWFTQSSNSEKILTTFETDIENIGLVAGAGATYDFSNFSLRLDIRYNHNFKSSSKISAFDNIYSYDDIPEGEKFHYTDDINLINLKNIQVSFGILYNLRYKVF